MSTLTFETILKELQDLGSDDLNRFGGTHQGGIHLQQDPEEWAQVLIYFLGVVPPIKNYLEIGSAAGGSCYTLNKYLAFDNVVLVDDNNHRKAPLRREILKDVKRIEIIGNAHDLLTVVKVRDLQITFDLLMVDADPTFKGMTTDIALYSEFLKPSGHLVMHNITESSCREVRQVHAELCKGYLGYKNVLTVIKEEGRMGSGVYVKQG